MSYTEQTLMKWERLSSSTYIIFVVSHGCGVVARGKVVYAGACADVVVWMWRREVATLQRSGRSGAKWGCRRCPWAGAVSLYKSCGGQRGGSEGQQTRRKRRATPNIT